MSSERPSTVRQLINVPPLGGTKVLAGDQGLDNVVTDLVLRTQLEASAPPQAGEVVVLDVSNIGEHLYQIDIAIRVCADAGASALIIANAQFELGLGALRLATRFQLPLIALAETDAMAITHQLRTHLWAPDVAQAAVVNILLARLGQARITSVQSMVDTLAELTATRVSVLGRDRNTIAGPDLDVDNRRLAGGVYTPTSQNDNDQTVVSGVGYCVDWSNDTALHSTAISFAPGDKPAYWLVAESLGSDSAQRLLRSLLQIGSWCLTSILASQRVRAETDARRRVALLNEILDTNSSAERDIDKQMQSLGWSAMGWNTGLHIKVRGADSGRIVDLYPEIRDRLTDIGLEGPLVERTDGWSGWLTDAAEPSVESYAHVVHVLASTLEGFVELHAGLQAHAGIGRPYRELDGLRATLTEAHEAAVIAHVSSAAPSGAAHIDQLGVRRILISWFSSDDFARYAHSVLSPIIEADPKLDLLRTLEVYLDASCSTTNAAHELGLHRNTVTNRIGRIVDVLGVRLEDPEIRLSLQLACRVLRLDR